MSTKQLLPDSVKSLNDTPTITTAKSIVINRANVNNLKDVTVSIPRNTFTIISGVSGSGKSSLAFDTLYAEGQRRFVESLSSYARQFLERKNKPDVESITGLPPAIAIEQKTLTRNPRSTVGTTTEVYDYLRLLFGRIGLTQCKVCNRQVKRETPQTIFEVAMKWDSNDRIYILYQLKEDVEKSQKQILDTLIRDGYTRLLYLETFNILDLQEESFPENTSFDKWYVVVDRMIRGNDTSSTTRLYDSIEATYKKSGGYVTIRNVTQGETYLFSKDYDCPYDNTVYQEPEPRLFSFNNPFGACPTCQGFGRSIGIDEDLVIPDTTRSLAQGAIHPFKIAGTTKYHEELLTHAKRVGISITAPIMSLPPDKYQWLWDGDDEFIGLNKYFKELEDKAYKIQNRILLSKYRGYTKCHTCKGSRLRTSARQVFIHGYSLPQLVCMTLETLNDVIASIHLTSHEEHIASQLMREIRWRLQLLVDIGVEYLTLDRLSHTLSGGESQRLNLATSLGSSLVGTLYVLDEPSIGLHPRDTQRLVNIILKLRNLGNTVVVVEHDPDIIKQADRVIDIGPRAGEMGGSVLCNGTVQQVIENESSLTGQYLSGKKRIALPAKRRSHSSGNITIHHARENNVSIEMVSFPLGCMTVVTGVSGSGKSTLIHDVLYGNAKRHFGGFSGLVGKCERIEGLDQFVDIELVDQSPIGRSSRSTPVTYTKAFDAIREEFSSTQAAKQLGWKPGHFSFNVEGGRCEQCEGSGTVVIEMQFLPDIELECESCKGSRYKREARSITIDGKSIVDILSMTVDEAMLFFHGKKKIVDRLQVLADVGLGYLRLGQSSSLLSGGEAQRVKLATHMDTSEKKGSMVYIFDEPTTGLHFDDIATLLNCFAKLIEQGHTVIVIEHNTSVMLLADWIIDLGPEAGARGGKVVSVGTPETIAKTHKSTHTGKALANAFEVYKSNEQVREAKSKKVKSEKNTLSI